MNVLGTHPPSSPHPLVYIQLYIGGKGRERERDAILKQQYRPQLIHMLAVVIYNYEYDLRKYMLRVMQHEWQPTRGPTQVNGKVVSHY